MITAIEQAIIEHITLAAKAPALGYRLPEVESYAGELDDDLVQAVRRFPAVWVAFGGAAEPKPYGTSKTKWLVSCTFVVMVGARNIQRSSASRLGNVNEPGAYQISDHVQQMLLMQDFGLEITPLQPKSVRLLMNARLGNEPVAVLAQEWGTQYLLQAPIGSDGVIGKINPAENWPIAQPPDWLKLNLDYYLKPGDNVADASNTIILS